MRHTRFDCDWSSDVCSSDLADPALGAAKAGVRDLAALCAAGRDAGTTVSATCAVAAQAGIRVFATGGIGGGVPRALPGAAPAVSPGHRAVFFRPGCVGCARTHGTPRLSAPC